MSLEQAEKHALELLADGLRQRFGTALWRVSLFDLAGSPQIGHVGGRRPR